jgi:hypothetical protein
MHAELAGAREHACELLRRMAALAAIEADADEVRAIRQASSRVAIARPRSGGAGSRISRAVRPSSAGRARAPRPALRSPPIATPRAVWVCGSKISAGRRVGGGAPEAGHRHRLKSSAQSSTLAAGVVDVEEALQVGEGVAARSASTLG